MASRRSRKSISLATKSAQLALVAPQVIAQRAARMALAGPHPSRRDRQELIRMGSEKAVAFLSSWNAIALQIIRMQQAWAISSMSALWMPRLGPWMPAMSYARRMQDAAVALTLSGLVPIHRAAVANAKRLTRITP